MLFPAALPLALAVLAGGAAPDGAACPQWSGAPAQLDLLEQRLVEVVNQQRLWEGRRTLERDPRLDAVARAHALASAARGWMGHESEGGRGPRERLVAAGIDDFARIGENLATASAVKYRSRDVGRGEVSVGCHDVESLTADLGGGWARSPGHRRNLLDRRYTHVGSAVAYDPSAERVYAVHVFGGRAPLASAGAGVGAATSGRAPRLCAP